METIAPPDASPVKPTYIPPPGACDAHCHIFGPGARFPYAPNRRYTPPDAPKEMLAALHRHLGLPRAVLVQASCHGTDNRAMLDAIASSSGAWRGVAMVEANVTDSELEALHAGGVRGVRFNFVAHLGGAPDLNAVDLVLDLMKNELAWVKVSGPERISAEGKPFHDAVPFARALIDAAPDRVLWGTDFPHPNVKVMPNDGELVDLFALFTDDEDLRRKVLVDNPARLYWSQVNDPPP